MEDIFDKIIHGEIPSYKVYEDEDVFAFLDISQATPGHTLVVPKADVKDIFAYDDELAKKILTKLPIIARAVKASNPKILGINILSNNGVAAGQSVPHSHWHIIPRYENDGLDLPGAVDHSNQYDEKRYKAIAKSISEQF
ncbi:diadenosine tetraphosphate hydrolase [Oenococcus oeni S25]|uniref:HIT family protein n=1 Tax=Oenococcus oeni TaxID=1247 RepID=UPI00050DB693|nr:HIT family protein [Oenococcus oeni]AVI94455.1 diadenosine tetraphosphate hydrolase [Oenococcus oeni]KGH54954.1 diadenosine tetraphosphate hydrolase [Oenococcus oeni S22]KGH70783.1 diadenosine tetraphosphate hydrolase [Oenococcus oeni S25]KGH80787.1 diadenosine tetraphosphate hydrolase [Oenococcus oeni IOEB_0607]KGH90353.1 diadenosine tetraphosphate hydrolase [Oenococcus oeni IOEB_L26_1]